MASASPSSQRALRLLAAAYFFSFGSVGVQVAFLTPALSALGFAAASIGTLWAVRSTLTIIAPAALGTLADRLGSDRTLAALSLAGAGLSLALLVGREDKLGALLLFGLYGLVGTASVSLLDGLVLTALGTEKHRYGQVRLMGAVGFGVCALTSTQAAARGWMPDRPEVTLSLAAGLMFCASTTVLLCPPLFRPPLPSLRVLGQHLRGSGLGRLGLLSVLHWASHGAYTAFIAPLAEARGAGQREVGLALAASIVVEVVVMRLSGRLISRYGVRTLLVVVCAVAVLRWALLALTDDAWSFVLLQGLHGVSFGLFYPVVVTRVAAATPEEGRQAAQGMFTSLFFGVGGASGMWLSGTLLEHLGARATWTGMSALAGAALALAAWASPARR